MVFILILYLFAITAVIFILMPINYPFTSCEHPQRYFNKYLGQVLTTPCRNCFACLNQKNFSNKSLIDVHAHSYKYVAFITLTFNQSSIPLADIFRDSNGLTYLVDSSGVIISSTNKMSEEDVDLLKRKVYKNKGFYTFKFGKIPYLDYALLRSFIVRLRQAIKQKRMRKYLSKKERLALNKSYILVDNPYISYETFTFYSVGEYGPESFRPHFHLLLFFQSCETLEALRFHLSKVWKFGNTDFELTSGNASSYLASYASANSCLPSIYQSREICPKSRHSFYFGFNTFEGFKETLFQERSLFSDKFDLQINGRTKSESFTLAYKNSLFPRCQGYLYVPRDVAFRRYTLAKDLYKDIVLHFGTDVQLSPSAMIKYLSDHRSFDFPSLRYSGYDIANIDFEGIDKDKIQLSSLATALRISFKFYNNARLFGYRLEEYFSIINDFWSNQQSLNYRRFLAKLERFTIENPDFAVEHVYDDTYEFLDNFVNSAVYRSFKLYHYKLHSDTIKHKSLNDFNNILYNF